MCHCVVGAEALLGCEGSGRHVPMGTTLPGQEGSGDKINYNNDDGGRHHKRGGADNDNKQ